MTTATVAGQSIAFHVTGYPDIPNRWGTGHIRVTGIRLDYGNSRTPDGRHAFVTGLWVREDGEVTDAPVDRYYDAHDGDTSTWPEWIADLAKQHTPSTLTPCTCRQAVHAREHTGLPVDGCTWCMPTPNIRPCGAGPAVQTVDARLLRTNPEG